MVKFKSEFKNCTITINSPATGRITLNTATVNPNHWAGVKEFSFMLEEIKPVEDIVPAVNVGKTADNWEDFTLSELRERFPEIKSNSKKIFIEQINNRNDKGAI